MKAELIYEEHQWAFYITAENEVEKCALAYLQGRPANNFGGVHIEPIPILFVPQEGDKSGRENK